MKETRSRVALVADMDRLWAIGGYDGMKNLSTVGREIGGDFGGYSGLPTKNATSETTLAKFILFLGHKKTIFKAEELIYLCCHIL